MTNATITADELAVLATYRRRSRMSDKARRTAAGLSHGRFVAVAAELRQRFAGVGSPFWSTDLSDVAASVWPNGVSS